LISGNALHTLGHDQRTRKLYLAGPLFSLAEHKFNEDLAAALSPHVQVFLPQRDNSLLVDLLRSGLPLALARKQIFDGDMGAIRAADILLVVLDGRTVDEGACFELGVGHALGKTCVGLQTDPRRLLPSGNNPMIEAALLRIFSTVPSLVSWISTPER
jgi:nucleoside 2-deoxyribosyltransferase